MLTQAICTLLLVVGFVLLWKGVLDLRRASASCGWPTVEAQVMSSAIELHRGGHIGRSYDPVIRYRYEYRGNVYEGTRFKFSGIDLTTASKTEAEEFLLPFRPGTRVNVHVCPEEPRLSTIEPGLDRRLWVALLSGVLLVSVGIAGLVGRLI